MKSKWIVNVKGAPNEYFEISVLRKGNNHGRASYGWFDENKLYVSGSGGPCCDVVDQFVFERLVKLAQEYAEHLNKNETLQVLSGNPEEPH